MVRKFKDISGMPDMFIQQAIAEKTALFEAAKAELQKKIDMLEGGPEKSDSGLSDIEDRNELLALKNELRSLEERYLKEIAQLNSQNR